MLQAEVYLNECHYKDTGIKYKIDDSIKCIDIRSDSKITFNILCDNNAVSSSDIDINIEDLFFDEVSLIKTDEGYKTNELDIFHDFFGESMVVIRVSNLIVKCICNILLIKKKYQQIDFMLDYLRQESQELFDNLLSRTKGMVSLSKGKKTTPEIILNMADSFVAKMYSNQVKLKTQLKTKLISKKTESWKIHSSNMSPYDVLDNIHVLHPTYGTGDVYVRGRYFNIGGIMANALIESSNILENQILLSGLHSIRNTLTSLKIKLNSSSFIKNIRDEDQYSGYLSLDATILAKLNNSSFIARTTDLIKKIERLIIFFERDLGVICVLNMKPILTPTVRASNLYRVLFEGLVKWYKYGNYELDVECQVSQFFLKLKSLSKIFEYYVFFRIRESLIKSSWHVVNEIDLLLETNKKDMALEFTNSHDNISLTINYQRKIEMFNKSTTKHLDLVDVYHGYETEVKYRHFHPDFILTYKYLNSSYYSFLDAKFSTKDSIKKYRKINEIVNKYYLGVGVYNKNNGIITKDHILSVAVIYPETNQINTSNDFGMNLNNKSLGLNNDVVSIPYLGAVPLSLAQKEPSMIIDHVNNISNLIKQKLIADNKSLYKE